LQIELNPQTLLASVQPCSTHLGKKPDETQRTPGAAPSDPTREDSVHISPEARALASELEPTERAVVREMQARDTEVRSHENAHAGAGGALAGAPRFTMEKGPDGRMYAVGGEVPIRVSAGSTPEETLRSAQQVRAAALAPAEPSSADRSVAASAAALERSARQELAEERRAEEGGPFAAAASSDPEVARRDDVVTERAKDDEAARNEFVDRRVATYGQVPADVTDARSLLSLFG
jgi:hypothetical protein